MCTAEMQLTQTGRPLQLMAVLFVALWYLDHLQTLLGIQMCTQTTVASTPKVKLV
jgi:hypothetical protein